MSNLPYLGVDIVEISRFRGLNRQKDERFFSKIFTPGELDYCFDKEDPAPHLAVRFAAKEAAVKALAAAGLEPLELPHIEIRRGKTGPPTLSLKTSTPDLTVRVSLSHTQDTAIAVVVVDTA